MFGVGRCCALFALGALLAGCAGNSGVSPVHDQRSASRASSVARHSNDAAAVDVTSYPLPQSSSGLVSIAAVTGKLWFTTTNPVQVGSLGMSSGNFVMYASPPNFGNPGGIVTEPSGHLAVAYPNWALDIDPSTNPIGAVYYPMPANVALNGGIAVQSNGQLWFTGSTTTKSNAPVAVELSANRKDTYVYDEPNGVTCNSSPSVAATVSPNSVYCPAISSQLLLFVDPSTGAATYSPIALAARGATTQVVADASANVWATTVNRAAGTMAILETSSSGAASDTFTELPANADSGAMSTGTAAGRWTIGQGIDFVALCGADGMPSGNGDSVITLPYGTDPATPVGGVTSDSTGAAWFLDVTKNRIVNVAKPQYDCPESADSTRSIKQAQKIGGLERASFHFVIAPRPTLHVQSH